MVRCRRLSNVSMDSNRFWESSELCIVTDICFDEEWKDGATCLLREREFKLEKWPRLHFELEKYCFGHCASSMGVRRLSYRQRVWKTRFCDLSLSVEIGVEACTVIEHEIKHRNDLKGFRRSGTSIAIRSTTSCFQLFSKNSNPPLSVGAPWFSPLQVTVLNLSENYCKALIVSGKRIIEYLPVSFKTNRRQKRSVGDVYHRKSRMRRTIMV